MSDAKKILNERLAKGEISSEEYEKISVLVDSNEKPAVDLNEVKVGDKKAGSAVRNGLKIFGFIFLGLAVIGYINSPSASGLTMANVSAKGNYVYFDIVNNSSKSGDILLYVIQDEIEKCPHLLKTKANWKFTKYNFRCSIANGKFNISYTWADTADKGVVSLANRIDVK